MEAEDRARRHLSALMNARRADLRLRWDDVAARAEISVAHLRRVRGDQAPLTPFVAAAIEDALKWSRGSIERILQGGEPTGTANLAMSATLSATSSMTASADVESERPAIPDHPPPDLPRDLAARYGNLTATERAILWLPDATPGEREQMVSIWQVIHQPTADAVAAQAKDETQPGTVSEMKRRP